MTAELAAAERSLAEAAERRLSAMSEGDRASLLRALPDGAGQYLFLGVDNFNEAPETENEARPYLDAGLPVPAPLTSYLRLGAVPEPLRSALHLYTEAAAAGQPVDPTFFDPRSGEDLAVQVLGFSDDSVRRCAEAIAGDETAVAAGGAVPDFAHNYQAPAVRAQRSQELHTLGGWREHTEGNRVTTTRGDKVEVIGGNYKLLVLGRDANRNMESGADASGGHIGGDTGTRGAQSRKLESRHAGGDGADTEIGVTWERRSGGVWRTVETSSKGDSLMVQHGDRSDTSYGHYIDSTTGNENPHDWHEAADCLERPHECKTNPRIADRTWATRMEINVGSPAWRVPLVQTETWVDQMRTEMHLGRMEDATHAGTMSMLIDAAAMVDETRVDSMATTTHVDGPMMMTTVCNTMNTVVEGNTLDLTLANTVSVTAGLMQNQTFGGTASLFIGGKADLNVGARLSLSVSATVDILLGSSTSNKLGAHLELIGTSKLEATAGVDSELALVQSHKALLILIG